MKIDKTVIKQIIFNSGKYTKQTDSCSFFLLNCIITRFIRTTLFGVDAISIDFQYLDINHTHIIKQEIFIIEHRKYNCQCILK